MLSVKQHQSCDSRNSYKGGFIPDGYGSGYSAVGELIDSLVDFKLSGKPIIGFIQLLLN